MAIRKTVSSQLLTSGQQRAINLLEVIGNASVGGMETYITNFITHLPAGQFNITCICPYESPFTTSLRDLGHDVYITPITDNPLWRSIQLAVEVTKLHQIDVLHAHMPKAHVLAGLAGSLAQKPVVANVHGMEFTAFELSLTRLLESHLITNCQETYGQVLATGIEAERVTLIHNGVDLQVFTPDESRGGLRQRLGLPENTPLVGFSGRLAHEKGPDLFIRAAGLIHNSRPEVHFVLVGDGAMKDQLTNLCRQLGLENHVHFVGWQTLMVDLYRSFDLLVHTSRSDGTSLVLLEAMACGCPVVAMDVGGVREIVENDGTGLLAPAGDWEGIAFRVLELLAHRQRLQVMRVAARLCVEKKFNLQDKTQCTADLLRRVAFQGINAEKPFLNGIAVVGNGSSKLPGSSASETTQ